jgi:hypothetical protein
MDSMFDSISPNGEGEDVGEEDIEDIETAMGEKEKKKGKKLTSPPSIF